jgi:myosin heavy subunit
VCGSTASRIGASIENQILDSNPLLESFGNAKTMRNNNSSRFGKYMEVNCDKKNNIKGCNIKAYLLEKSRVVKQGPMERNYHVFYMLLAGATKEMKKNFGLKPVDQFYYLSQSGCTEVDRRSDLKEFEIMMFAMQSLAIDVNVQNFMLQLLAAVLHLGYVLYHVRIYVSSQCCDFANSLACS